MTYIPKKQNETKEYNLINIQMNVMHAPRWTQTTSFNEADKIYSSENKIELRNVSEKWKNPFFKAEETNSKQNVASSEEKYTLGFSLRKRYFKEDQINDNIREECSYQHKKFRNSLKPIPE